jgi:hypothetical protein
MYWIFISCCCTGIQLPVIYVTINLGDIYFSIFCRECGRSIVPGYYLCPDKSSRGNNEIFNVQLEKYYFQYWPPGRYTPLPLTPWMLGFFLFFYFDLDILNGVKNSIALHALINLITSSFRGRQAVLAAAMLVFVESSALQ